MTDYKQMLDTVFFKAAGLHSALKCSEEAVDKHLKSMPLPNEVKDISNLAYEEAQPVSAPSAGDTPSVEFDLMAIQSYSYTREDCERAIQAFNTQASPYVKLFLTESDRFYAELDKPPKDVVMTYGREPNGIEAAFSDFGSQIACSDDVTSHLSLLAGPEIGRKANGTAIIEPLKNPVLASKAIASYLNHRNDENKQSLDNVVKKSSGVKERPKRDSLFSRITTGAFRAIRKS